MTAFPDVQPGTRFDGLPQAARDRADGLTVRVRDPGSGRGATYFLRTPVDAVQLGSPPESFVPPIIGAELWARIRQAGGDVDTTRFNALKSEVERALFAGLIDPASPLPAATTGQQDAAVARAQGLALADARRALQLAEEWLERAAAEADLVTRATLEAVLPHVRRAQELTLDEAARTVEPIHRALDAITERANQDVMRLADAAEANLGTVLALAQGAAQQQAQAVTNAEAAATNEGNAALRGLEGAVRDLLTLLRGAGIIGSEFLERTVVDTASLIADAAAGFAGGLSEGFNAELQLIANQTMPGVRSAYPEYEAYLRSAGIAHNPAWVAPLLGGFGAGALLGPILSPFSDHLQHEVYNLAPTRVPGPSDLVTMELREVFRPEDFRAQLDPPPSPDFRAWMRRQGYAQDWADRYWAAHWTLPSVERGLDMFHRLRPGGAHGVRPFTVEDLRTLLRKQDVLPLYHDQLIATAYTPLTRVDVRRMFRLGVLDKDEVREAYLDLGYDGRNAQRLADFVERDVEPEERRLTVQLLTEAYVDGLLGRDELEQRLDALGYGAQDLDLLMDVLDRRVTDRVLREAARKERQLRALRNRARRDLERDQLDREEFDAQLAELELTAAQVHEFWAQVTPPRVVRDLSAAQLLRLLRAGTLDEDGALRRLAGLGYKAADAQLLVDAEAARAKDRTRELTSAQVLRLYRDGLLERAQALVRLLAIGYDDEDAGLLVTAEDVRAAARAEREALPA